MPLAESILKACYGTGCSLVGFASAEPFLSERRRLLRRQRKGPDIPFAGGDLLARTEPSLLLPGAKSIISLGYSYRMPAITAKPAGEPRGTWSRFARVKDYHKVLNAKMAHICAQISRLQPGAAYKYYVDTGPLLDRAVAYRAGLGFWGKNNCLIHEKHGSFMFLGEILLDFALDPSPANPGGAGCEGCQDCQRCLKACPTGALTPNCLDYRLCLSYLSQSGEYIPLSLRPLMGDTLYGCDLCQEACPYNKEPAAEEIDGDFLPIIDPHPSLLPLLEMSKKDFAAKFQESPIFWRGRNILQRNAIIALGNLKAKEAQPRLGQLMLEDPRPQIRGYSAWALGRIGGSGGLHWLAKAVEKEREPLVLQEITEALYQHQKG